MPVPLWAQVPTGARNLIDAISFSGCSFHPTYTHTGTYKYAMTYRQQVLIINK